MKKLLAFILLAMIAQTAPAQMISVSGSWPAEVRYDAGDYYIWFSVRHFIMSYHMMVDSAAQKKYDISELKEGEVFFISKVDHPYLLNLVLKEELCTFLLLTGRAQIEHRDGRRISSINAVAEKPIMLPDGILKKTWYNFTDPETGMVIFRGAETDMRMKNEH
jgi:hypothetical protein